MGFHKLIPVVNELHDQKNNSNSYYIEILHTNACISFEAFKLHHENVENMFCKGEIWKRKDLWEEEDRRGGMMMAYSIASSQFTVEQEFGVILPAAALITLLEP